MASMAAGSEPRAAAWASSGGSDWSAAVLFVQSSSTPSTIAHAALIVPAQPSVRQPLDLTLFALAPFAKQETLAAR